MKVINVKEVLRKAQEVKPKPKIKITRDPDPVVTERKEVSVERKQISVEDKLVREAVIQGVKDSVKSAASNEAWAEYNQVKIARKKLSSAIYDMVEKGATKEELKEHYARIVAISEKSSQLYLRAKSIEQNGKLPEETDPTELLKLKDDKRKVIDLRSKLQAKIKKGEAKNPGRVTQWHLALDKANAEYQVIDEKIKRLTGR